MRGGELRHYIAIEQKTVSVDANGDRTEAWATLADVWASIASGAGREYFAAKQVIADLSHTLVIRWIAGVTPDMRVRFDDPKRGGESRYFNIRAVASDDERSEMITLQCSEITI